MNKNSIKVEEENKLNKIDSSIKESINNPLKIIKEDTQSIIEEPKSPRKDIVVIKNENDIDETSSLANFFQDMKQIAEDKGIKIESNKENNYSLFEDASEVEK